MNNVHFDNQSKGFLVAYAYSYVKSRAVKRVLFSQWSHRIEAFYLIDLVVGERDIFQEKGNQVPSMSMLKRNELFDIAIQGQI